MTYDELYDHVVNYVAMPHTTITEHDKRRACLILGAFMDYIIIQCIGCSACSL